MSIYVLKDYVEDCRNYVAGRIHRVFIEKLSVPVGTKMDYAGHLVIVILIRYCCRYERRDYE